MKENDQFEENTISLAEVFNVIKKYFWFLVIITLAFGVLTLSYAMFIAKDKFKTTGALIAHVEMENGSISTSESANLINTLLPIINDIDVIPTNASNILKDKGYDVSGKTIKDNMVVSHNKTGRVISISYTSYNEEESNLVVKAIIDSIMSLSNNSEYENMLHFKNNVSVFDISDAKTISPNKTLLLIVGIMSGGVTGLIIVFAIEVITSGFKTKEELERALGIQVLGEIPEFKVRRS